MKSRSQLSETIGHGDLRRTSLIFPRSSSSPLTAIADIVLAADSFKTGLLLLEDNNNREGRPFLKHDSKYISTYIY